MKGGERTRDREEKWSGVCNYGGGREQELSGVEQMGEGRGDCVRNVMREGGRERAKQEEVGEGREERRRGEGRGGGKS